MPDVLKSLEALWHFAENARNLRFRERPHGGGAEIAQARCRKCYARHGFIIRSLKDNHGILCAQRQVIFNQFAAIGFKSLTASRYPGGKVLDRKSVV